MSEPTFERIDRIAKLLAYWTDGVSEVFWSAMDEDSRNAYRLQAKKLIEISDGMGSEL